MLKFADQIRRVAPPFTHFNIKHYKAIKEPIQKLDLVHPNAMRYFIGVSLIPSNFIRSDLVSLYKTGVKYYLTNFHFCISMHNRLEQLIQEASLVLPDYEIVSSNPLKLRHKDHKSLYKAKTIKEAITNIHKLYPNHIVTTNWQELTIYYS
jgi:hypothetical protein